MFGWVDLREDEKKNEWKIGKKMCERVVWLGERGGEKNSRAWMFSLQAHQNSISPKWRENRSENVVQNFGLKCPLTNVSVVQVSSRK